jgi:hypothetical protein
MTRNLTRQSLGGTLVLFTLLMGLFWARHFMAPLPAEAAAANTMPLGQLLDRAAQGIEWVHAAISLLFIYMTAICVTRMMSRNLVFQVRTHTFLPLLAVAGFGIFIRDCNAAAVIAMYLLARGSDYFASAFRRHARPGDLFGGGLMFGLAPLLHATAVFYIVLIPLAMIVYMRNLRETVLALIGALLPASTWLYILWATGGDFEWPAMHYNTLPEMDLPRMVATGLLAATVLVSLASFMRDSHRIRTRAHRIHLYMIFFLIIGVAGWRSVGDLPPTAVPAGVVAASWLSRHEGIIPTLFYALTITATIFANCHLF